MNKPPNRDWAYALIKRWDAGDRKNLSPAALKIAYDAIHLEQKEHEPCPTTKTE